MKKAQLKGTFPPDIAEMKAVKDNIEAVTGRRGERCDLAGLNALTISATPTQAEVEFLRSQLAILVARLEE